MYTAIIVKLAQEHDENMWLAAGDYAFEFRHTLTASHDDTIGLLQNALPDSYAKIIDPHLPSQQATIQVLEQLGLNWIELDLTPEDEFTFSFWPTDYRVVTQRFGANPQNYEKWDLPGHDGVDIRAPHGTNIYAVANGVVTDLRLNNDGHNYGIFVRVQHIDSYETTYAHLDRVNVSLHDTVVAGQIIGFADNTGNSNGSHLHLTLKKLDVTYTDPQGNVWPYHIHSPEPFMQHFEGVYWPPIDPPPATSNPAIGLHLRADPFRALSGEWAEVERLAQAGRPKIIKLLHAHPAQNFVDAATKLGADAKYIVRIFQTGWTDRTVSPHNFVQWNIDELNQRLQVLHNYGVPYNKMFVEIHNEPNLAQEGWNSFNWVNGTQFGSWLAQVINLLDDQLPAGTNLMYPGLSPGHAIADIRYDAMNFFLESKYTLDVLDALGVHSYWLAAENNMQAALNWVGWHRNYTNKQIFVTEASIVDRPSVVDVNEYGKQYATYVNLLGQQVSNTQGVTFYVGSASNPYFEPETWVLENNHVKGIAQAMVANL